MRRGLVAGAVSIMAMFGVTGIAQAQDPVPAPEFTPPPAFVPPSPAPVVDVASAEAFTENYADRNAARFLRTDRRSVRVLDANAACLEHPVVVDRFGCVFTLRALTIERRSSGWDDWGHKGHSSKNRRDGDHGRKRDRRPRFRIRTFGCLGLLSVQGGPTVTPSGTLRALDCVRVRNADIVAPEPVA